jgi:hypothetical protein
MSKITAEALPPGTHLLRVYQEGTPEKECKEPFPFKWCVNLTPPESFTHEGVIFHHCKVLGAVDLKCTPREVKALLTSAKEIWPYTTHIWWTHNLVIKHWPILN